MLFKILQLFWEKNKKCLFHGVPLAPTQEQSIFGFGLLELVLSFLRQEKKVCLVSIVENSDLCKYEKLFQSCLLLHQSKGASVEAEGSKFRASKDKYFFYFLFF